MQIVVFVVFLLNLCNVEPSPHRPSGPLFNWSTPGLGSHFSVFVYLYLRIWHIFQLETLYQATVSPDRTFTFLLVFVFVSIPNHLSFVICTKASIRQVRCPQTELSLFCSLLLLSLSLSLSFRCLFIIPKPLSGRWAAPRLSSHFSARCFSFGNKLHRPPTILLSYA